MFWLVGIRKLPPVALTYSCHFAIDLQARLAYLTQLNNCVSQWQCTCPIFLLSMKFVQRSVRDLCQRRYATQCELPSRSAIRSWLVTFFLLIRDAVTLTFDPLILNDYMYRLSHDQTLCQIWAKSNNLQLSFSYFRIEQVVRARFSKGNFSGLVLRIGWTDLY